MNHKTIIKGLLALFLVSSTVFAQTSKLDELLEQNKIKELVKLIKSTKVIEDETQLPDNPKNNELVIIENEYDVKVLFEYLNDEWSEKSGKVIADILNDQKSTYMHLFNYKVSNQEFNPYISDDVVKNDETPKRVFVKILESNFNEKAINTMIKVFSEKNLIEADEIINIQVIPSSQTNCKIIFTYKQ